MKNRLSYIAVLLLLCCTAASAQNNLYDELMTAVKAGTPEAIADFNATHMTVRPGSSLVRIPNPLYPDDIWYGENSTSDNLMPLVLDIVPDSLKQAVQASMIAGIIRLNGGLFSGDERALPELLPYLSSIGRSDVAALLTRRQPELLEPYSTKWHRTNLAGIPDYSETQPMILKPDFTVEDMTELSDSLVTPLGTVVSSWTKDLMQARWTVTVPKGMKASAIIPGGKCKRLKSGTHTLKIKLPMPDRRIVEEQFLFNSSDFPTCHSSSITQLRNGDLLAVYSTGQNEAAPDTRIMLTRKKRGSDSWSTPVEVSKSSLADTSAYSTYNPVVWQIPTQDGDVLLFYHTKQNMKSTYLRRSFDQGYSWSEPELLPEEITGPERAQPIFIDGKILAPGDARGNWLRRPIICISDDMGHTWRSTGPSTADYAIAHDNRKPGRAGENWDVPKDGFPRENAFEILWSIQPSILVHKNGLLQYLGRTVHSRMSCCWSYDRGETWGNEYLCDLPSNQSGFSAITLRDGRFVRVFNNFESIPGTPRWEHNNARTPLTLAISEDGILWEKVMDIETGPIHSNKFPSGYCYPNIIEGKDGCLHLVYTWQRTRIKYVKIKL